MTKHYVLGGALFFGFVVTIAIAIAQEVKKDVPFVPSWVGKNVAVYGDGVEGVEDTLDPSYIFRFWVLSKNG